MSEKVSVVYRSPKGDSKVNEWGGHTFYDGQATELDSEADAVILKKMEGHPHFEMSKGSPKSAVADKVAADNKAAMKPDDKPKPKSDF